MTSLYREPDVREAVVPLALEFVDVFRIYQSGPAETVALRGFDMRVELEEFVAVFGPSGSGKSTMLRLAAGLEDPSAGEVRALGRSLTRASEGELESYRARELAVVFQKANVWPELTALENVELALRLSGRPGDPRRALGEFGLHDVAHRRAALLSGGEQQRVALASAAVRRARLLLADEPTAELDRTSEATVLEALRGLRDAHGASIVVVTHSPAVAAAADRVIVVRDGRVMG